MLEDIVVAKHIYDWFNRHFCVMFEVKKAPNKTITIKNVSAKTAYNVTIEATEDLFGVFNPQPVAIMEPDRELICKYTRLTSSQKNGSIIVNWTDSKNKGKKSKAFPICF